MELNTGPNLFSPFPCPSYPASPAQDRLLPPSRGEDRKAATFSTNAISLMWISWLILNKRKRMIRRVVMWVGVWSPTVDSAGIISSSCIPVHNLPRVIDISCDRWSRSGQQQKMRSYRSGLNILMSRVRYQTASMVICDWWSSVDKWHPRSKVHLMRRCIMWKSHLVLSKNAEI